MKYLINIVLLSIFIISSYNFKLKSRSGNRMKITQEDENKPKPLLLNITYENPLHDLDEQRKYAYEHIAFNKKVKQIESSLIKDIENLKALLNVQNIQIEKLNEIYLINLGVLYQKIANDYKNKFVKSRIRDGYEYDKKKNDTLADKSVKVDFNNPKSVEEFKNLLVEKNIVKPEFLGAKGEEKDMFINLINRKDRS